MTVIPVLSGIRDIADDYDGFILDLWGVLHDGAEPYPGVLSCLKELKNKGKTICLLSNAPRRSAPIMAKLTEMGITRDMYDHIVTSGEVTHQALKTPQDFGLEISGPRCFHIGDTLNSSVYEDQTFEIVSDIMDADFILNTGPFHLEDNVSDYEELCKSGVERDLLMICANPDKVVVTRKKGSLALCAGGIAGRYETLGGRATYFGKPYKDVYNQCVMEINAEKDHKIIAVGDGMETDIRGAHGFCIDSVLVAGGIHRESLCFSNDNKIDPDLLENFAGEAQACPDMIISTFLW